MKVKSLFTLLSVCIIFLSPLSLRAHQKSVCEACFKKSSQCRCHVSLPKPSVMDKDGNKEYTVNGVRFKMIAVAGGTFTMGATS